MTEVAVTGFSRAGKTAFLTSLYWNILHQMNNVKKGYRSFGVLNKYEGIRKISVTDNSFLSLFQNRVKLNPFDLEDKKRAYYSGVFPKKTFESESFAFDLLRYRSKWNPLSLLNKVLPTSIDIAHRYLFVDFPGERIADVNIARNEKFEAWSKSILSKLAGDEYNAYRDLSARYRELLENASTQKETLIKAYKDLLVDLVKARFPLISPSVFMLSKNGERIKKSTIDSVFCGLSEDKQFVPLSDKWKGTEIYKSMQASYNNYRKELVLPLFNIVETADVLVVLFDIADILTSGYDSYKANVEFLDNLVSLCKASPINKLKLWSVKKVAFVATQCDRVAKGDAENLLSLLKELTDNASAKLINEYRFSQANVESFYCAACQSTTEGSFSNTLKMFVKKDDSDEYNAREYKLIKIPEYFPKNKWEKMKEEIPYTPPPEIKGNRPPLSINLDKILKFILD